MDKKKKIIVAIVTLVFIGVLLGFVKLVLFPSNTSDSRKNQLSIITPKVDERKIDRVSKIREYTQGKFQEGEETDVIRNFSRFQEQEEQEEAEEGSIIVGVGEDFPGQDEEQSGIAPLAPPLGNNQEGLDSELKELMRLQEQFLAQSQAEQQAAADANYMGVQELEHLLKTYDQYAKGYYGNGQQPTTPAQNGSAALDSAAVAEATKKADDRLASATKEKFSQRSHFQGAGAVNTSASYLDLVPAETVDQSLLFDGSTVAIRTKKAIQLNNPSLLIPQGAVVYGRVSFSTNRLFINISSYKEGNKLYQLNFKMFDFDGREGVHLGNRTWPKIPSKVAEDAYDFLYQRGTQANGLGQAAQDIDLGQARDIAILSATNEVAKEIFDKRRILMPKKYHLWLNISTN